MSPSGVMKLDVLSFSIAFAPVCIWAQAQADAPQVPEIEQILAPLRALEAKAGEAVQTRTEKYLADLKTLETNVAKATGELEQVLVVRKEREAWEKGKPTPVIDPKDESKPLELRKLRYYFDRERGQLETQAETALAKARQAAAAKLKRLEDGWTREKKIELAVAARKVREGLAAKAVADPDTPKLGLGEKVPFVNDEPGTLRAWGKTDYGVEVEKTLPKSGRFVQVATRGPGWWFARARNGDCISHDGFMKSVDGMVVREMRDITGFVHASQGMPINKDGQFWTGTGGWTKETTVYTRVGHNNFRVRENGDVEISGRHWTQNKNLPKPPVEKFRDVVMGNGSNGAGVFVREDGSAFGWHLSLRKSEEFPLDTTGERIVMVAGAVSVVAGLGEHGRVFFWAPAPGNDVDQFLTEKIPASEGPFTDIRVGRAIAAARKRDGSWVAWGTPSASAELIAKINALGPVKDLALADESKSAWVIWIE